MQDADCPVDDKNMLPEMEGTSRRTGAVICDDSAHEDDEEVTVKRQRGRSLDLVPFEGSKSGKPYFNRAISASIRRRSTEGQVIQVTSMKLCPVDRVLPCSHGNSMFTTLSSATVGVWDMATGGHLRDLRLTGHVPSDDAVSELEWSPNSTQLAVISKDGSARIWDAEIGGVLFVSSLDAADVKSASWSPDGRTLAVCARGFTIVFDVTTGFRNETYLCQYACLDQVRWSPCGEKIAAMSDSGIVIWHTGQAESPVCEIGIDTDCLLTSFCWSSDSTKIAVSFCCMC